MELPVTLTGAVAPGNKIGRQFSMPTANIYPNENISGLTYGVYYSVINIDGKDYLGITNLGVRPTISEGSRVNAETFIYDFHGDLYGKTVLVTLLKFRRSEIKFDSLDELYRTIADDFRAGAAFHNLDYHIPE